MNAFKQSESVVVMYNSKTIKENETVVLYEGGCVEISLELSRQKHRDQVLTRYKYIKTCVLARELCLLVRTNRVAFTIKDAHDCCVFISQLCSEAGCKDPSGICRKASDAVLNSEENYLEMCAQSCMKCGEARRPQQPKKRMRARARTQYVA